MGRNVEIKARVRDPDALRKRIEPIADRPPEVIHQHDTFFPCGEGRLKLRRFSQQEGELIFYRRSDSSQPSESNYLIVRTADPEGLAHLLSQALGKRGSVVKQRTLYWSGQTRIHLDRVEGLGDFVELEVVLEPGQPTQEGLDIASDLMARLGIKEDDLLEGAYIDLLESRLGTNTQKHS